MVDVVVNHYGYYCGLADDGDCGPQGTIDYSTFNPFNSEKYFHPFCEIDYNNATSILDVSREIPRIFDQSRFKDPKLTLQCWEGDEIVPLVDLRTEDADVQAGSLSGYSQIYRSYSNYYCRVWRLD
jgi:alpha-amylase